MIYSDNFSDLQTIKSFETKTKDFLSSDKLFDSKFEENFINVFCEKKLIELDEDNDLDIYIKEKPSLSSNYIYSRESKDNTLDKSKIKSCKNKEDNYNDLSYITILDKSSLNSQKENEIKEFTNTEKENPNFSKSEEKSVNIIVNIDNFLGKKRKLFKTYNSEDFLIFNCGEFNINARELINKVIKENAKNALKEKEEELIVKSGNKKKYCKKILNVEKRKENADNIRKKIKCRFFKTLKQTVNEKLKLAGSEKLFKNLSQKFISNVAKDKNKSVINLSFKDLFLKNFYEEKNTKGSDLSNYSHNIDVIEYLEQQNEISKKSNFINFKNMKLNQIYNEYLKSKQFEMEITSLKREKENEKYIKNYIIKASSLIEFFSN